MSNHFDHPTSYCFVIRQSDSFHAQTFRPKTYVWVLPRKKSLSCSKSGNQRASISTGGVITSSSTRPFSINLVYLSRSDALGVTLARDYSTLGGSGSLDGARHGPHADNAVSVASVQGATVRAPVEGKAVRLQGLLAHRGHLGAELIDDALALKIPDLDARLGGSAQPVPVGAEAQAVDDVTGIKRVQALALREIPEHSHTVLATGGAERAVGGHGHRVDVASVAHQVGLQLAVGQVPHLHQLVPASGHDDGVGGDGGEAHARHPLGVAVLLLDGVLALAESVPQLNGLVARAGHDLTVVHGEGHGQNVLAVADEAAGGGTGVQIPQAQGTVPGAGQGELAIGGDNHILDEMAVTAKSTTGVAVGLLVAGQRPHDHGLVAGRRQDHVRVVQRAGDGGHPVLMTLQGTAEGESLSHCDKFFKPGKKCKT
eukprot:687344-Prorocentrum_minimum.AAC.2